MDENRDSGPRRARNDLQFENMLRSAFVFVFCASSATAAAAPSACFREGASDQEIDRALDDLEVDFACARNPGACPGILGIPTSKLEASAGALVAGATGAAISRTMLPGDSPVCAIGPVGAARFAANPRPMANST